MIRRLALTLFVLVAAATATNAAPTGLYAPATGLLVFHEVGFRGALVITSDTHSLLGPSDYHLPPQQTLIGVANSLPDEIGWLDTEHPLPDPFNAGLVAPPGTPMSELHFKYAISTGTTFLPVQDGLLVQVPEPASLVLASCGARALFRRRK